MRRAILLVILALSLWPQSAIASFGNCTNADYVAIFDARLVPGPCEEIGSRLDISGPGGAAQARVITREGDALPSRASIAALVAQAVEASRAAMAAMGTVATHDVSVWLTTTPAPAVPGVAFVGAIARRGSSECHVTVYDAAHTATDPAGFRHLLAHELFHCVQFRTWPGAYGGTAAKWWTEGSAEYFANLAQPGTNFSNFYATGFEAHRELTLTYHSYNAVVFFFWLGQTRGPSAIPALLATMPAASGHDAQNAALRAAMPIDEWMRFEENYLDGRITKPGGAALSVTPAPGPTRVISASQSYDLGAAIFSISGSRVELAAGHVYSISVVEPPSMRVHWTQSAGGWAAPPATVTACDAPALYRQAVGAVEDGGVIRMQIRVSDEGDRACCPETTSLRSGFVLASVECPLPPEPEDAGDGGGRSFGEPHLLTFDRHELSFQMAGEFVLTRSPDGFEVQTRQERLPAQDVSANTAVAVRIGPNHRIAVYAQAPKGAPIGTSNVYIDGKPVDVTEAGINAGTALIRARGSYGYDILLVSGYRVFVDFFDWNGFKYLDVEIRVPKSRRGALTGLLGNYDGNPANDLRSKDGRLIQANSAAYERFKGPLNQFIPGGLPLEPLIASYFNELYSTFGNSWRIAQSESLFDYGTGESTATFTQTGFPARILTLASVSPRAVDEAQRVCTAANVPSGTMNGCVFDVAMTGNSGFADALGQIGDQLKQRALDEILPRLPDVPGAPSVPGIPGLPEVPRIPGF